MEQTTIAEQSQQGAPAQTDFNSQTIPAVPVIEKSVPQSEVNKIIGDTKVASYEKGRAAALAEFQRQQMAPSTTTQAHSIGGMPPVTQDLPSLVAQQIDQKFQELQKQNRERDAKALGDKIAADFDSKLESARANYNDFDTVTQTFPFAAYPNAVLTSLNFENAGDIAYELASNPLKFEAIENLAKTDLRNAQLGISSNLAHREMQKLSESIRLNKAAQNVKTANAPLSQIQPSPTGTDNGRRTTNDFRKIMR